MGQWEIWTPASLPTSFRIDFMWYEYRYEWSRLYHCSSHGKNGDLGFWGYLVRARGRALVLVRSYHCSSHGKNGDLGFWVTWYEHSSSLLEFPVQTGMTIDTSAHARTISGLCFWRFLTSQCISGTSNGTSMVHLYQSSSSLLEVFGFLARFRYDHWYEHGVLIPLVIFSSGLLWLVFAPWYDHWYEHCCSYHWWSSLLWPLCHPFSSSLQPGLPL